MKIGSYEGGWHVGQMEGGTHLHLSHNGSLNPISPPQTYPFVRHPPFMHLRVGWGYANREQLIIRLVFIKSCL